MLYLTNQLNLNLQNGDKIEITVIETANGGIRLGISAPNRKSLHKALADVEIMPAGKGGVSGASEPAEDDTPPQAERRKPRG